MSVLVGNPFFLGAGASAGGGGYQIERSLRFNTPDNSFLSRTPASAGNKKTWTWAGWVKRSRPTFDTDYLIGCYFGGSLRYEYLAFTPSDSLDWFSGLYTTGGSTTTSGRRITTAVYRDTSAWYHIVLAKDTTQATAANRVKLYVNGVEVTTFSTSTDPAQNDESFINATDPHRIGSLVTTTGFYGYLADVHFIDGQALTPSDFTEVSATTGQLIPKAYTGSFGTNGFWLKFSDNSAATATTLGKDYSGNSNNWTPNNLSVTAGAGNDSLVDTPTNGSQTDTGVGGEVVGNYCTWNPLEKDATTVLSNGNLNAASIPGGAWLGATFAAASGKWYYEITTVTGQFLMLGVADYAVAQNSKKEYTNTGTYYYYGSNGQLRVNGVNTAFPDSNTYTFANNDVIGVAFDCDAGTVNFYRNGSKVGGASNSITGLSGKLLGPALSAGSGSQECIINAGQRPFAYTAPSGFKALCTTNLPAPVVAKPSEVMDVKLYTGNGSTQSIALGFSPDFLWFKARADSGQHALYDVVRGASKSLVSNSSAVEATEGGGLSTFDSAGFSLSGDNTVQGSTNGSGRSYVTWAWDAGSSTVSNNAGSIVSQARANTSAGFSIVTYTGTGADATVGHGLGAAPSLIIVKARNAVRNWPVYHASTGASAYTYLDGAFATVTSNAVMWQGIAPTSTVFSVGTYAENNGTNNYVAYCFAPVAGYSMFGNYTGNGSTDGPMVWTGFRPKFLLYKNSSITANWGIYDAARDSFNVAQNFLRASLPDAEIVLEGFDFLSNGFKVRTTSSGLNGSGNIIFFAAFAESPFKYARAR